MWKVYEVREYEELMTLGRANMRRVMKLIEFENVTKLSIIENILG